MRRFSYCYGLALTATINKWSGATKRSRVISWVSVGIYTGDPIEDTSGLEYCETHTCEYLPLIAEYFVLRFIPATAPTLDQKLVTIAIDD